MKKRLPMIGFVFLVSVGSTSVGWPAIVATLADAVEALSQSTVHGAGSWHRSGGEKFAGQRWVLDVQRGADGSIAGRVALAGSPLAAAGNVEGRIEGRKLFGTISDDAGVRIADFHGVVGKRGITGVYRDRTGEVGRWSWDGSLE